MSWKHKSNKLLMLTDILSNVTSLIMGHFLSRVSFDFGNGNTFLALYINKHNPAISPITVPNTAIFPARYNDFDVDIIIKAPIKMTATRINCSNTCAFATGVIIPWDWKLPFNIAKNGINNVINAPVRISGANFSSPIMPDKTSAPKYKMEKKNNANPTK